MNVYCTQDFVVVEGGGEGVAFGGTANKLACYIMSFINMQSKISHALYIIMHYTLDAFNIPIFFAQSHK